MVAIHTSSTIARAPGASDGDVALAFASKYVASDYAGMIANAFIPLQHIAYSECVKLYYQSKIDWPALQFYARLSGINLPDTDTGGGVASGEGRMQAAWRASIQGGTPVPDIDIMLTYYRRGLMLDGYFDSQLRHQGIDPANYRSVIVNQPTPPPPGMCLEFLNRGLVSPVEFKAMMHAYGYGKATDREHLLNMRHVIPPAADLIRFSVREVWQQDVVSAFGYDEEFPLEFAHWMQTQGLGWTPGPTTVPGLTGQDISWARAYWRAHWEVLSPHMAFESLHRLRPGSPNHLLSRIEGIEAFTTRDLDKILKVHDYPPKMREWLKGLSYARLTRVDIRRASQIEAISPDESIERYRDLGYTRTDAELLQRMSVRLAGLARDRSTITRMRTQLATAYELGTIDRLTYQGGLFTIIHRGTGRLADFERLTATAQHTEAAADPSVSLATREVDLRVANQRIRAATKAIITAYVEGRLTRDEMLNRLAQAGIAEIRAQDIAVRADWIKNAQGAAPTLERLSQWRKLGILPAVEYRDELVGLGFEKDTASMMIAQTESSIMLEIARAEEKLATTTEQGQRAIKAQLKAIELEKRQAQGRLAKRATRAEVLRWYRKALVSRSIAERRLKRLGYADVDIEIYLSEIDNEYKEKSQ